MEALYKLGVKIDLQKGGDLDLKRLIPVFQRWIQEQAMDSHLLIDVHDYSHVPHGPGVLLVAHQGNFHVGEDGDRLGLTYTRKQPLDGDLANRIRELIRIARRACERLESETDLGSVQFAANQAHVFANDRLLAPNTAETTEQLRAVVAAALGNDRTVTAEPTDHRDRVTIRVEGP